MIILAGFPATTAFLGTSFSTTLPAPMTALSPMVMPPMIHAWQLTVTLSPMIGRFPSFLPSEIFSDTLCVKHSGVGVCEIEALIDLSGEGHHKRFLAGAPPSYQQRHHGANTMIERTAVIAAVMKEVKQCKEVGRMKMYLGFQPADVTVY